jgi:curved DNA-binding protein CbpA
MGDSSLRGDALSLLGRVYRARASGLLLLALEGEKLRVALRDGQIVAVGSIAAPAPTPAATPASAPATAPAAPPATAAAAPSAGAPAASPVTPAAAEQVARPAATPARLPRPDDSVGLRLQKVLLDLGLRKAPAVPAPPQPQAEPRVEAQPEPTSEPEPRPAVEVQPEPTPEPEPQPKVEATTEPSTGAAAPPAPPDVRVRLLAALAERSELAEFLPGAEVPEDCVPIAGATEPLILEAVKRLPSGEAVREALGDLEQRLVGTTALAEERTLTLTEGYLLSRIDGQSSAREVLQLVPLDPDDTERTLLGLLLTGRVEYRPPRPRPVARPEPVAQPTEAASAPDEPASGPEAPRTDVNDAPRVVIVPEMDPETLEQRHEILELFQALPLKNHFEVLGVRPGCSDADVKRAYTALAKRFHPDVNRDPRLEDLSDILEAIFIRVGEAWEVLGGARSRAAYESRFVPTHRAEAHVEEPRAAASAQPDPQQAAGAGPEPEPYVMPEDTLNRAGLLLAQARYWDAIQMLESAVPHMQPQRHQHRGRILLARAYAKNPNWLRQAQDQLKEVVREDPENADALFELGLVYKSGGFVTRAQAMFRRALELNPDHREAAAELAGRSNPPSGGLLKKLFGRGRAS